MGFDASQFGLDPAARRFLQDSSYFLSVNDALRQHQNVLREIVGIERIRRSVQISAARVAGDVRSVEMVRRSVSAPLAQINENFRASRVISESVRRGLPGFSGNLAGLSYHARMQSEALRYGRMFGNLGLSNSIAQAFKAQGLTSAYGAEWRLQIVQSIRTSALQSLLKTAAAFGPIVVTPDFEDDAPFDYWPDLQWLFPDTTTEPGDATDVEELWAEVVAIAQGIAHHHRTKVLLSVMGNGTRFLIRVCKHPVTAEALGGGIGGSIGFAIGGPVGAMIGGASGPIIAYVITRL